MSTFLIHSSSSIKQSWPRSQEQHAFLMKSYLMQMLKREILPNAIKWPWIMTPTLLFTFYNGHRTVQSFIKIWYIMAVVQQARFFLWSRQVGNNGLPTGDADEVLALRGHQCTKKSIHHETPSRRTLILTTHLHNRLRRQSLRWQKFIMQHQGDARGEEAVCLRDSPPHIAFRKMFTQLRRWEVAWNVWNWFCSDCSRTRKYLYYANYKKLQAFFDVKKKI